jgi:hypothetical protein
MRNILSEHNINTELLERLKHIEELLIAQSENQRAKEFYSVEDVAKIMDRSEYCVREWCRGNRIHATKAGYGRGRSFEWRISHEELCRLRSEGLLPLPSTNGAGRTLKIGHNF